MGSVIGYRMTEARRERERGVAALVVATVAAAGLALCVAVGVYAAAVRWQVLQTALPPVGLAAATAGLVMGVRRSLRGR